MYCRFNLSEAAIGGCTTELKLGRAAKELELESVVKNMSGAHYSVSTKPK